VRSDDHGGCRVILRGEDVATHPAHVGAELRERLDEDRRLHGHVQRPHDARARKRLLSRILGAQRHQAGHFVFREADFLAAERGERQVAHLERRAAGSGCGRERGGGDGSGHEIRLQIRWRSDNHE
jgi:hypothetical protein